MLIWSDSMHWIFHKMRRYCSHSAISSIINISILHRLQPISSFSIYKIQITRDSISYRSGAVLDDHCTDSPWISLCSPHLEVHKVADQCKSEWMRDIIAFYRIHRWSEIPTDWFMIWLIPIDEMRLLMELMNCFFFEQFESIVSTIDCFDWLIVSVVIYMVFSWTNAKRKSREMEAEQLMTPIIRRYSQCLHTLRIV